MERDSDKSLMVLVRGVKKCTVFYKNRFYKNHQPENVLRIIASLKWLHSSLKISENLKIPDLRIISTPVLYKNQVGTRNFSARLRILVKKIRQCESLFLIVIRHVVLIEVRMNVYGTC